MVLFRVIKEGVCAAGANATKKYIEEISLCGMFLLEVGKKANSAFKVPPQSIQHNVRDPQKDIQTIIEDLLQRAVVEQQDHHGPPFADPTTKGMKEKAAKGWIESVLKKGTMYDEDIQQ